MNIADLVATYAVYYDNAPGFGQASHGRAEAGGDLRAADGQPRQAEQAQDAYIPAGRDGGRANLETPHAIRGDDAEDSVALRTCYCGQCSRCKADATARREAAASIGRRAGELSENDERHVEELRQRDQHVRAHEQAHAAAGATNVMYTYQIGPDGRPYAVGGSAEISIQASSSDPDSKIAQARRMRAAALAPADPSAQDAATAARATQIEMEAQAEKTATREEQTEQEENQKEQPAAHFFAIA